MSSYLIPVLAYDHISVRWVRLEALEDLRAEAPFFERMRGLHATEHGVPVLKPCVLSLVVLLVEAVENRNLRRTSGGEDLLQVHYCICFCQRCGECACRLAIRM